MTVKPQEILDALLTHKNVLLYGPPGTGKTWLMKEVSNLFLSWASSSGTNRIVVDTESETRPLVEQPQASAHTAWVTFHQSYSYEDFVMGLRPDPKGEKLLGLSPRPGVLMELAVFANEADHHSLLLIDEINRGNVSRIFGEFITLLEPEKRLGEDGGVTSSTVTVSLPYLSSDDVLEVEVENVTGEVTRRFSLPQRLYTLASMNSVDKSIAPVDTALRRRFHVISIPAAVEDLEIAWGVDGAEPLDSPAGSADDVRQIALQILSILNAGINSFRGPDFGLGQWYLKTLTDSGLTRDSAVSELASIWESLLLPQLEELFHGRTEQLAELIGLNAIDSPVVEIVTPVDAMVDLGARSYLVRTEADDEAIVEYLRALVATRLGTTED